MTLPIGVAVFAWTACFVALRAYGAWWQFAVVGVTFAAFATWRDARTRAMLRVTWPHVALGCALGLAMAGATHVGYRVLVQVWPALAEATSSLFAALHVSGYATATMTCLIVVVAATEEFVFRGVALEPATAGQRDSPARSAPLARVALSAGVYALTTVPLGSALLVACAFGCGLIWGALRLATGSLVVAMLAHVIWDLGALVLWPLQTN
ncbi:MAG: CPBP family intramembrane metalloprotease [Myxococcales bacterium]|nr:CPBP family intramembrane metalloprotease [Myxococcales bacterium]